MDKVSEYVKSKREAKNISLDELAKGTLISVGTLKDIESGRFDKYKGDEPYIKMYLKKIATFLELDTNEITQLVNDYVALTQEIELHDIQEQQEKMRVIEENKKNVKVTDKLGETLRDVKTSSTIVRKRKHVYEDNFWKRYLKYGIIILLCAAIVGVVWFSMVQGKSDSVDNYTTPKTPSVDENKDVTDNSDKNKKDDKNEDKKEDDKKDTDENKSPVVITHLEASSYNIGLKPGESFKLEITFGAQSTYNLYLGASPIPDAYKVYNPNETYVYETTISGNETYTLNIWNMENVVIKVNGNVLEYNKDEVRVVEGVSFFTLYMKGE